VAPALRLHLVTLGVDDVAAAARFYEALGMKRHMRNAEGVAFFDAGGVALSLYGRPALAKDAGVDALPRGSGSATLAFNVDSEGAVDETLAAAEAAGGKILKPGYRIFWGGYIGYFADPEGHLWEVAYNPQFSFDDQGRIVLPA
jgi:catechol 2,3-dioxygenase-like lactoylglutathione lyase family enzyme